MKKVYKCEIKGYDKLKAHLLNSTDPPNCGSCVAALAERSFDRSELEKFIQQTRVQQKADFEKAVEKEEAKKSKAKGKKGKKADAEASAQDQAGDARDWKEYVQQFDYIELLPPGTMGKTLPYRCLGCRTRRQPEGKIGDLNHPSIEAVEFFLKQHFRSQAHKVFLANRDQPKEEEKLADCQGLPVDHPELGGWLYFMREEFKIWASHTSLEGKGRHTYEQKPNSHEWLIKANTCLKQTPLSPGANWQVCAECRRLGGGRKSVVRNMSNFCAKYHYAMILNARLFQGPELAAEAEEKCRACGAFRGDPDTLEKTLKCNNNQLQQVVRGWWEHTDPTHFTKAGLDFLSAVVRPTLNCNVSSFNDAFSDVIARFSAMVRSGVPNDSDLAKIKLAGAALDGSMEGHPLLEGMALQCLRMLEKQSRGVNTMAGRPANDRTEREFRLVSDAGLRLCMATGNAKLGRQLLGERCAKQQPFYSRYHFIGQPYIKE